MSWTPYPFLNALRDRTILMGSRRQTSAAPSFGGVANKPPLSTYAQGMAMIRRTRKEPSVSGAAIQAAEHEAAKQRILQLAEAERTPVEDTTQAAPKRRWRDAQS